MTITEFAERILYNLPYVPTDQQVQLIAALAKFCSPMMPSDSVFLLAGYAGTGKTSLGGALVRTLQDCGITSVLLAPTGRAAKVFSQFAGHPAYTIHRKIYRPPPPGMPFGAVMENPHRGAVFIVDEASMIGGDASDGVAGLLTDLIHYVYTGDSCRLILLGDTAQLPPVGCMESPAMNPDVLRGYGLRVTRAQLTDTVRQAKTSGILYNATMLRRVMRRCQSAGEELPEPCIYLKGFGDVKRVPSEELEDEIGSAYSRDGVDETVIVTRANWRATQFNLAIRQRILDRDEELCRDDLLMVVKNNYYWSSKVKDMDFIANGDMARVARVYGMEEKYGLRFADVTLQFPYRDVELECKIVLDCLTSDTPALTAEQAHRLYESCYTDPDKFDPATPHSTRMRVLRTDPYFNALQVKYGYAVTCHKAQGGQWRNVIVDMAGIAPEALHTMDLYRWLYTAVTRATTMLRFLQE
ncbi:MAG: AAA family ATPase [Muribaculaceae bacterium]|nr:AAA family ATPase [Muribaculaceae bacterium]